MKTIIMHFAVVAFAVPLAIGIVAAQPLQAQSSQTATTQVSATDSASKMSFDVVSVKVNNAGLQPAGWLSPVFFICGQRFLPREIPPIENARGVSRN